MHEICPHCGKVSNEESPRFCSGCGARMDGSSPAMFPGSPFQPKVLKNSTISGFCSSVLPGLGQIYNGETKKGFILFLLAFFGLFLFLIPGLIVWLYAMYDAYTVATKMNTGEIEFCETQMFHMVSFIAFAVVVIVVVLLLVISIMMTALMAQLGPVGTGDYSWMFGKNGMI
jgi:TM2 domain-containing membrane protein YozV